jgi:ribulose 1,5-bisphosphate synthetase/thiazole synthase
MMHSSKIYATLGVYGAVLFNYVAAATVSITRDVVVVGGGASGAHAAVWLRDHGKSVAVIEKRDVVVIQHLFRASSLMLR